MRWIVAVLYLSVSIFGMDIGINLIIGAGAEEIASRVLDKMREMAPSYVTIHTGTSTEYDLNFEAVFLITSEGKYGVIWKENGKEIESFSHDPDSPIPLKFFIVDAASVPLERAALLKLKKGDWGKFLRLTYRSSVDEYPSFSPDGRFIIFSSDRYGGNRDPFIIDSVEGKMIHMRIAGSSDYFPSFSPDGKLVLFQGSFTGNWGVYTIPSSGDTRKIRRIAGTSKKAAYMPVWAGDREVMYITDEPSGNSLYIKDITTKIATRIDLPFDYVFYPRLHDGVLYFVGLDGADFGIYSLRDGTVGVIEDSEYNEYDIDISKDGSMVFVSNRDGVYRLWLKNLKTGEVKVVTDFIDYDVFYPAFHPSGKIVAISVYEPDLEPDIWLVRLDVSEEATGVREERKAPEEGTEGGSGGIGGS